MLMTQRLYTDEQFEIVEVCRPYLFVKLINPRLTRIRLPNDTDLLLSFTQR